MNKPKNFLKLLLGIVLIVLFVGYVGPAINQASTNKVMLFINENDINTGALLYTESERGLKAIEKINLAYKFKSK